MNMPVTRYRSVENKVADSNFENHLTVRTTLKPMYRTVDLEGVIIGCNDKYAHVLGYTRDEVIYRESKV